MVCKKSAWKKCSILIHFRLSHKDAKSKKYIVSNCYIPTYKMGMKILVDLSDREVKARRLWKQINLFVRSNTKSWVHKSWILTKQNKKVNLLPFRKKGDHFRNILHEILRHSEDWAFFVCVKTRAKSPPGWWHFMF